MQSCQNVVIFKIKIKTYHTVRMKNIAMPGKTKSSLPIFHCRLKAVRAGIARPLGVTTQRDEPFSSHLCAKKINSEITHILPR